MPSSESQLVGHALHIPDLLRLICDRLDLADRLSLMKTSKGIFFWIVSEVWREVEAQVLTDLIVETSSEEGNMTVDFSRFDIYVPFVKQLRVYGRTARYFSGERRRASVARAQLETLFPNTVSVTLLTSDLYRDSDALFWLDLLLTPTLRQLCIHPTGKSQTAWVCDVTTRSLINRLATNCPALDKLEFYPMSISRCRNSDNRTGIFWPDCPQPSLNTLSQLRSISTTISMVSNCKLAALGALPCLRNLTIRGCGDLEAVAEYSVSSGAFLCLTHLALLDLSVASVVALMGVERLACGITHLKIVLGLEQQRQTICLSQSFTYILKHCRRLKSFHYDARGCRPYYGFYYTCSIGAREPLEAMSRLPLEQVTLLGLSFDGSDYLPYLELAFSRVVKLHIGNQQLKSTDLHWFTKIPKLRDLALRRVLCIGFPQPQDSCNSPLQHLACAVTRETYQKNTYTVSQVARFFVSLWPNLRRVSGGRILAKYSSEQSWFTMCDLNDEIASIRGTSVF